MRFIFGKTEAQLAAEKAQAEKLAQDAKWAPVKRDAESRKAHHEQLLQASKKHATETAMKHHQDKAALLKQAALDSEKTRFEKKEPKENPAAKLEIFPTNVVLAAAKTSVKPELSQSNYQSHDALSKKELDANKKAFWHGKNEAEKTKREAFKKASTSRSVTTQTFSVDDTQIEEVGPKKPSFFEVSAARRNAILEARKQLTAEEKATKKSENRIESALKIGL